MDNNLYRCGGGIRPLEKIFVGTYNNRSTQTFDCSEIKGHEHLSVDNFTIFPNSVASASFDGAGNSDLKRSDNVTITNVSYTDPVLTVVGKYTDSRNMSTRLTIPIYCIKIK